MTYNPVTFTPGEPLDVTKLNNLQSNIKAVKTVSDSAVQNATLDNGQIVKKYLVSSCGTTTISDLEVNVFKRGKATYPGTGFSAKPILVTTVASEIASGEDIDIYVKEVTANEAEIWVRSNKKKSRIDINWIAIQMKQI